MEYSKFAKRFTRESGIVQLMQDLGDAMAGDKNVFMLGGGNPAHIPEVQAFFVDRMQRIIENPAEFSHVIGNYDPPGGDSRFIQAVAGLLNEEYGWGIGPQNIVLTGGSQAAFFMLFNMLGGEFENGERKKILLPMAPEYIGYSDVGLTDDLFTANRPVIDKLDKHTFKYRVDFSKVNVDKNIGAICISRPTNPTGNVLTDEEVIHLSELAETHDIPLIIDNAYGMPFPNIIFTEANPVWTPQTILCMSLSKLGLPAARTGIVIAQQEIVEAIETMNGILNLALSSLGPAIAIDLINSREVIRLSQNIIRPYYENKAQQAIELFTRELEGLDYYIHKAEGAFFLWLWFPGLPITSEELYQRLKKRGVLVISGHHFFPGLPEEWPHKNECIRVSYAMPENIISAGIKVIAEEIKAIYQ